MKNLNLVIATSLLVSLTTSCLKESVEIASENVNTEEVIVEDQIAAEDEFTGEQAFFGQTGETKKGHYLGMDVTYSLIDDQAVFEGDIILDKEDIKTSEEDFISENAPEASQYETQSVGRTTRRWPNNTVYYTISSDLPRQSRVTNAISEWEAKTNLRFIKRTNQRDYIKFIVGNGCSSSVGRTGGVQYIRLAKGCGTGAAIHEIGHAIGLWHEQSRADRNKYIKINFDNIKSGTTHNFKTYVQKGTDGKEYTKALDFNSVMMYSSYAFSKNRKPTITKLNGSTYRTQRNGLSAGDIEGVSKMYPAKGEEIKDKEYVHGQYYTIDGVRVYRYNNKWWYYSKSKSKWREVINRNNKWYFVS